MNELWNSILFLFAAAVSQNIVLTTGFGSSMVLRMVRRPKDIGVFSLILGFFAVATVAICHPLDNVLGIDFWPKLLRPLLIVAVVAVLYCLFVLICPKAFPRLYARIAKLLPLAAFNNLVIGIALICNHNFSTTLTSAIGLALGGCVGFVALSFITAEGIERLDNPDIPQAFRGLPITLVYVGLLALAILGFSSSVSLI